jgi:hypothetical protein
MQTDPKNDIGEGEVWVLLPSALFIASLVMKFLTRSLEILAI